MPISASSLTLALAILVLMHAYVYRRVTQACPLSPRARLIVLVAVLVLVAARFIAPALERSGWVSASRAIGLPAFLWIAWLFWFLTLGLGLDLWNAGARTLGRVAPGALRAVLSPKSRLALTGVLILAGTAWGPIEAGRVRVRQYAVTVPAWPGGHPPVRVALVSDVHLSTARGIAWSLKVTRLLAELKPDIVLSAGDLTDSPALRIAPQSAPWAALHPPLGKYAVLGNHDYYSGYPGAVDFHREAGFRLLHGESVDVGEALRVAGLDDPAGMRLGQPCNAGPDRLASLPRAPGRFTILLRHRPVPAALPPGVMDLQLSGHTHAGQVFPFRILVRLLYPHVDGWHGTADGGRLYVSTGTGTWGPPLRLFAPPEVALFILAPPEAP